jgi:predicted  nucleic acid-binding Zn-ribbon protein
MPKTNDLEKTILTVSNFANDSMADIENGIKLVRARITEQRKVSNVQSTDLEKGIAATQVQIQQIQQEIDSAKASCNTRKNEIANWEKWYESQLAGEKASAFVKLNAENNWRMGEVNQLQGKISNFEAAKLALFESLEKAKEHLAAVNANVHKLPIEQDPRLKGLLDAKAILQSSLPKKAVSKKK